MVLREGRSDERAQLLLVLGAGDDHVGELSLARDREHALVARSVLADQAGTIHGDDNRQVVLADVVDFLIEGALQECRIQGDHRPLTGQSHPGGESYRVLLGDADVDEPVGELSLEEVESRARGHPGRDGHDPPIDPGQLDQLLREMVRVVGRSLGGGGAGGVGRCAHVCRSARSAAVAITVPVGGGLDRTLVETVRRREDALLARQSGARERRLGGRSPGLRRRPGVGEARHRWQRGAVEGDLVPLGGSVAAALSRADVDQDGARNLESGPEDVLEAAPVVAGDHAQIGDAQVLE